MENFESGIILSFMDVFFIFFTFFWVAAMLILTYIFGIRPIGKEKRCTAKTKGKVIRPSNIRYGDVRIPLVEYYVGNKRYKVAGPKFKSGAAVSISSPFGNPETEFETNISDRDNLPDKLTVKSRGNSFMSIRKSPLMELFPIGSEVDVHYNPRRPGEAYVHRYEGHSKLMTVMLIVLTVIMMLIFISTVFAVLGKNVLFYFMA